LGNCQVFDSGLATLDRCCPTVLLVEDATHLRGVVVRSLDAEGFAVSACATGCDNRVIRVIERAGAALPSPLDESRSAPQSANEHPDRRERSGPHGT
jgi:hypothetical protein